MPPHQPQPLHNGDEIRVSEALGYTLCQDVILVRQAPPETRSAPVAERTSGPNASAPCCASCGRAIQAKAVFCRYCGTLAIPTVRGAGSRRLEASLAAS